MKLWIVFLLFRNTLEVNVRNHQESDEHLQKLIDSTQEMLCEAYQYAGLNWGESCRDFEVLSEGCK